VREPRVGIEPISVRNRPTPRGRGAGATSLRGGCQAGVDSGSLRPNSR
jgi:hypothetical protein